MKKTNSLLSLFLLALVVVPNAAWASQCDEDVFSFGMSLFSERDYYRAITEFKRYLHLSPQGPHAPEAALGIGECFLAGERWEQADEVLLRVTTDYPQTSQAQKASLLWAESSYRRGDFAESLLRVGQLLRDPLITPYRPRATYLLAWSHLELDHFDEALQELARFSDETSRALANEIPSLRDLPRKTPELAGTLSALVPGAGQLYVGRPRDAVLSLLLNAAFLFGIVESFDDGHDVVGGILVFFEAGWYTGNIFNAVNGAHKFNRDVRQRQMNKLRARFGLGLDVNEDAARLKLQLRF